MEGIRLNEQHISLFKFGDEHRERFRDQLLGFQLPAEQLQFTGLPGRLFRISGKMPVRPGWSLFTKNRR